MSLTDDLLRQLQGQPLEQMSSQLGLSQSQTAGAVSAALPLLLGALGRNTSQPQGAEALFGALQRDHAGAASGLDIGSVLGAVLGGGAPSRQTDGAGILGHIFGGREDTAAQGLGQATGLGGSQANTLLKILAPIVLSYLAQRMFSGGGQAAASPQALGNVLGQERERIQQDSGAGGLLGAVLDQDGDGQLGLGDLLKIGGGLLGGGGNR
ncbi:MULTISPECIES: DUF937 domain-containing protein [unclassified Lysobacter]|uniref:DUF937 domain-containing protein n=1 Tax=unclassified Lysobacter TaxID=2635362 RepID=UPI0006F914A0|nr:MULTISPECIES: DUF937 domain-containing protein [unclassified Lysobacter]KRA21110.1 calcium-binding protein [Lysobacter sp. Root604]KRD40113.1 calcium-binding protein [Lysobacter sp. Root916]KRD80143.1 calcium-binding protein [Lysobacter sp. Root983]